MLVGVRRLSIVLAVAGAFAIGVLWPGFGEAEKSPTAVYFALAQSDRVQGAPGRELVLSRVSVDPGAQLALHHHLGTQVARIESGVLTYTVRSGSVVVRRGEARTNPRVVRRIATGQTARLRPGDWIVEQPSTIHQAANRGRAPVVLYLATLLRKGAPPATPVAPSG